MAYVMSKKDEGTLLTLFVREGYVLDFSSNDFDVFTTNSVGVALCAKYQTSKGKSLVAFLNEASDEDRTKLLTDLFEYYETHMEEEYNEDYEEDSWFIHPSKYNEHYAKLYLQCKSIINSLGDVSPIIQSTAEELKGKFSSEYMNRQIDLLLSMQKTNPTEAIGKSKELIESCCKTILEEMGIACDKDDDVPQLTSKVLDALDLLPSSVQPTDRGADAIKAVLGNLRAIPTKLAEIRNPFGSGHGKSASFVGLEERHARLAVGCSITFVDFVWSTYEGMKRNKNAAPQKVTTIKAIPNDLGDNTLVFGN